ncbi:MAG TPA: nucleotidyltransferase domain-containing protein [Planctomycetota bacterium]|nr:nucleotidyltransferase domain-containing protein [Planctomycetota bacterium]
MSVPDPIQAVLHADDLSLALLVRAGSKAYGIDVEGSDDDYVGVFVPPLRKFVSIHGIERDTYAGNGPDFTIHEIGKFCHLALKGNPAILEALWNPGILECDAWGRELLALRDRMVHRGSLEVYVAYAEAQMRKMVSGKGLHAKGGTYNGKYGAHLVRLLHAGIGLAAAREVMVRVPPDLAATLLSIRRAERSMEQVLEMARPLLERLKPLSETNTLPDKPDVEAVNDLVVRARLSRT